MMSQGSYRSYLPSTNSRRTVSQTSRLVSPVGGSRRFVNIELSGNQNNAYSRSKQYHIEPLAYTETDLANSSYDVSPNLTETYANVHWPPSIREAATNNHYISPQPRRSFDASRMGIRSSTGIDQTSASMTPDSFFNRTIDLGLPQMQYGVEAFSDEPFLSMFPDIETRFSGPDEDNSQPGPTSSNDSRSSRTSGSR